MNDTIRRRARRVIAPAVFALLLLALPAVSAADRGQDTAARSGGGGEVRNAGTCTGNSTTKIKVKRDDGRLEVEFEVDQNRNGQTWKVRILDNGDVVFSGTRTTQAPSGSFSVERRINDRPGTDLVKGVARNPKSGERCVARASI